MITLASIKRTTWAGVSQFEGATTNGCPVYVRYKWGEFAIWVDEPGTHAALEGQEIFWAAYKDRHNFDIVWNEVAAITGITCFGAVEDKYQ